EMEVKYSDRFCANLWFDEAMKWMDHQIEAKQPFFSYIALNTPHSPFHALEEDYNKYKDKVEDPNVAHFFGLISNVDDNYGRLDRWLEKRGIKDDTIIIFMNDNGSSRGDKIYNAGMRGKKGSGYEGGHRAICFIRWPNGGLGTPRTVNNLSHITDILPTFADLLEFDVPQAADPFDGVSLKSILRNLETVDDNRKVVVQFGGRVRPQKYYRSCVIWKNWRLIGDSELYDLGKDPEQKKTVSSQYPEIVRELKLHYDAYWASIEASIDVIEPVVIGNPAESYTDLTSNNWVEVDFDNRGKVAEANSMGGIWEIAAEKAGAYLVLLSRWPFYMERPLSSVGPAETIGGMPIDPGEVLPIKSGSLSLDGKEPIVAEPNSSDTFVEIRIELSKGRHSLQGWFHDAQGARLSGAFYGRVIPQ
ncbi:MAG: sulfatase-like hydrolase/transferase, partial [Opitutales bacterium]|nr:sulfatase-like hydrolase/transferase [Opitutales bacterium]